MNTIDVTIRPAALADVLPLRQLSIETFIDTYAAYNTPENMQLYIATNYNTQQLVSELADACIQYFLLYSGAVLAGYIKLRTTEEPPELAGKKHIEIERIYVLPAFKGMKLGTRLIECAVETATQQEFEVLWLGVWDENKKAQAFYTKQGFTIFGEHAFVLGTEPQRDWLMMLPLRP